MPPSSEESPLTRTRIRPSPSVTSAPGGHRRASPAVVFAADLSGMQPQHHTHRSPMFRCERNARVHRRQPPAGPIPCRDPAMDGSISDLSKARPSARYGPRTPSGRRCASDPLHVGVEGDRRHAFGEYVRRSRHAPAACGSSRTSRRLLDRARCPRCLRTVWERDKLRSWTSITFITRSTPTIRSLARCRRGSARSKRS